MVFVRQDIPSKLLSTKELPIEGIYIELNCNKSSFYAAPINQAIIISKRLDLLRCSVCRFIFRKL